MRFVKALVLGLSGLALVAPAGASEVRQCQFESIGTMTMDSEGAIHALLDICDAQAVPQGHKYLSYWKGEAEYAAMLTLVGGMRPGETKPIPQPKDKASF